MSATIVFAVATISALPVLADSAASIKDAGTKGHVTAYDADQTTVLEVQKCDSKGSSYDYVACGKPFRDHMDQQVCKGKSKGTKVLWYYQVSDSKVKSKQTAKCE